MFLINIFNILIFNIYIQEIIEGIVLETPNWKNRFLAKILLIINKDNDAHVQRKILKTNVIKWRIENASNFIVYRKQLKGLYQFATKTNKNIPEICQYILLKRNNINQFDNLKCENILDLSNETLNPSQVKAVNNAFIYSISLIKGPPGCGKTHTASHIAKVT